MNKPHWLTTDEQRTLPPEDFSAYPDHQPQDPLIKHGDYWYFWDEIYIGMRGPYLNLSDAQQALEEYREWLDNQEE